MANVSLEDSYEENPKFLALMPYDEEVAAEAEEKEAKKEEEKKSQKAPKTKSKSVLDFYTIFASFMMVFVLAVLISLYCKMRKTTKESDDQFRSVYVPVSTTGRREFSKFD